jgi:CHAD domain-containing protein
MDDQQLARLRHEVRRYRTRYESFGALEGARALQRILDLIDELEDEPRPIGDILRDLSHA